MVSPQCSDLINDLPYSIPDTTPQTSVKWCMTASPKAGCPTSEGCVSAASSLDKKPIPEEAGSVPIQEENGNVTPPVKSPAPEEAEPAQATPSLEKKPTPKEAGPVPSHRFLVKGSAPEKEESVPCFIGSPVPEENIYIPLVPFKLKSPAPEEQSADNVKHHLKDELDQNPLKEGPKGTNHRTDKENVQEDISSRMEVTSGSPGEQVVTDGSVGQIPPPGLSTVCASVLTFQILDLSWLSWALKKMKQNDLKLLLMVVIFLCLCDCSDAVECFVGWFTGTDLSNQTLVIRADPFSCVFDSPLTFPLIHQCDPLTIRMETMSDLQLVSENVSEYLVEYNNGNLGKSKTVPVNIRIPDCSEILDPKPLVNPSDRNHMMLIAAGITVIVGILVATIVVKIVKYKMRRSQSGDSLCKKPPEALDDTDNMERAQNIKNQQVKETGDNTTIQPACYTVTAPRVILG